MVGQFENSLMPCADFGVREHVDRFELHAELGKNLHTAAENPHCGTTGVPFMNRSDLVLGDILGDTVVYGRAHGTFLWLAFS